MRVRLALAVPTIAVALSPLALPATAASAATSDPGLYGAQDPQFDGVYRHALALIALDAVGVTPDPAGVEWLAAQQCADGAFTPYRASTDAACEPQAKDSNATGLAVQAHAALGLPTTAATDALRDFQLDDGGFYSNEIFGADPPSDANSTGIALSALVAAGIDPTSVTSNGNDGLDFLQSVQVGCSGDEEDRGAYDFVREDPLVANDYATAQATLGAQLGALPVTAQNGTDDRPALTCPPGGPVSAQESADAAAGYLARRLDANNGLIPSAFGGGTDYMSTANAVLSLVAARVGADQVDDALGALADAVDAFVVDENGDDRPAALASLILAARAGGLDPRSFGGENLVIRLEATQRTADSGNGDGDGDGDGDGRPADGGPPLPSGPGTPDVPDDTVNPRATLPATGGPGQLAWLALAGWLTVATGTVLVVAGRRP